MWILLVILYRLDIHEKNVYFVHLVGDQVRQYSNSFKMAKSKSKQKKRTRKTTTVNDMQHMMYDPVETTHQNTVPSSPQIM